MKVIVGMSGGVDSSVAAHLLKEKGFAVEGLSLIVFETRGRADPKSCCSLEAVEDARRAASVIGIPHKALDLRDLFIEKVITPFIAAYKNGLTPNPCILCNRHVKFPALSEEAQKSGAGLIATGHYARAAEGALKKALDKNKDQSYVLYALRGPELKRLVLPLGEWRKPEVKLLAERLGLPVFRRPESQEICFVSGGIYHRFIKELAPECAKPGPIVDERGDVVGTHKGIYAYTLGQRKGLGISSPKPLFVNMMDAGTNTIGVGPRESAMMRTLKVKDINWLVPERSSFRAQVKVRSTSGASAASVEVKNGEASVLFDEPCWTSSPGQSAVFYENDMVLGGGIITEVG